MMAKAPIAAVATFLIVGSGYAWRNHQKGLVDSTTVVARTPPPIATPPASRMRAISSLVENV